MTEVFYIRCDAKSGMNSDEPCERVTQNWAEKDWLTITVSHLGNNNPQQKLHLCDHHAEAMRVALKSEIGFDFNQWLKELADSVTR